MIPASADDKFSIIDTIHSYLHCRDNNDMASFADLFTKDGVLDIPLRGIKVSGKDDLARFCQGMHSSFPNAMHW